MQKAILMKLQTVIPLHLLHRIQNLHCHLLSQFILRWGSQPWEFSNRSAMVFSPHQDDETFGCGGMIAQKREQGINVVITFLTDGRGSHGVDQNLQNQIIKIRREESLKALDILGVQPSEIYFLDQQDGSLANLNPVEKQKLINHISELLKQYQPGEVYVPHHKDCHRDHEATFYLVKEAIAQSEIKVELLQYPIWVFWRAPLFIMLKLKDIAAAYRLSITSVQAKKKQAIATYASQTQALPVGFIKRFLGAEEIFFNSK
ncbi:PIG-L family deacetylase [Okeanomitos corallinicola TIOX110]|uniref:PIG-L family deacetylase n=1 Tax=Okeanomitos corallinicola TIOX110 TaxID=3133117 RepID=A0ABZ2UVC7_9CYAN